MFEHRTADSWLSELSWQDLQRLRAVVKKVYMKYYPAESATDAEADRIINAVGPETCEKLIKKAVDRGHV